MCIINSMKISVIIPVYKVEQYLYECIDSVLSQSHQDLEVILVDDGSPDGCPRICDDYSRKDSRVKVIHQCNQGLSVARNEGMRLASGEYIAFVDSDDVISPYMFETLLTYGNNSDIIECEVTKNPDFVFKQHTTVNSICYNSNILKEYLKANKVGVWCRIYRRDLINHVKFEQGAFSEDVMWSFEVFEKCCSYTRINAILYYWRQDPNSLSKSCIKHFKSQSERLAEIIRVKHPDLLPIIHNHLLIVKINRLTNAIRFGFQNISLEREFEQDIKGNDIKSVKANIAHILTDKFFRWQTKIKALLICVSYRLYSFVIKSMYGK